MSELHAWSGILRQSAWMGAQTPSVQGLLAAPAVRVCLQRIAYFLRKTTYSNRKFDIIDGNKWLIFYMPFYILNIRYYIINRSFYIISTQY